MPPGRKRSGDRGVLSETAVCSLAGGAQGQPELRTVLGAEVSRQWQAPIYARRPKQAAFARYFGGSRDGQIFEVFAMNFMES